jgi:hypothetical protein
LPPPAIFRKKPSWNYGFISDGLPKYHRQARASINERRKYREAGEIFVVKVIWATGTRTGSQFLVKMTMKALGELRRSSLTPGRKDNFNSDIKPGFQDYAKQGKRADYFIDHGIEAVKIEHCGMDMLLIELLERFPKAKVLTVLRPFAQIAESHHKIWRASQPATNAGWISPEKALTLWINDITQLEYVKASGRLLAIDLNGKESFDSAGFLDFLETQNSSQFEQFLETWPVVNDLSHQLKRFDSADGRDDSGAATAIARYIELPIVDSIEARYRKLLEA